MLSNISVDELSKVNNPNVIDIRNIENYNNNHIPSAINIPFEKLIISPSKYLKTNAVYYIYCQKGYTSATVCRQLANMGYKVVNITGGYEEWLLKK